jgi:glycosyltransferase involved in cell wall biosynthesis
MDAYEVPSESIRTVYCGVDPSAFVPAEHEERAATSIALGFPSEMLRIVFVGELGDHRKGLDVLFEAWLLIADEFSDVEVVVVGTGRLLHSWIRRAAVAGLNERIRFLGHRGDVSDILRSSDLLVAPSRYEPYGLNIAEAVSSGLPVIATRSAGACELLIGELRELLLTDPPSRGELLSTIRRWRLDIDRYRRAALDASERIRAHSWKSMSERIYTIVEAAFPAAR